MIESYGITIIRNNLDTADFDMNRLINQIYVHIIKSTKKPLIDDLSKRLLELEFKSNHSIKPKCLEWIAKKFTKLQKTKNTQLEIKPIKIGKRPGTTCFGCKDFTHNFRPQEVKMSNKLLREKCVVCWSNKSRFLKQKQQRKIIQRFTD